MMKKIFLIIFSLILSTSSFAQDNDYNLGVEYYRSGDYKKAFSCYLRSANRGNKDAQLNVGNMYYDGEGVSSNYVKAFEWWLKAANKGDAVAQFNLGTLYENGEGVSQDYLKAFAWYLKSANQGNVDAQFNLGSMYYNGNGIAMNYNKAFEWWQKAASRGDSNAQYWLGNLYENGEGITQDFDKSFELFRKAANQGHAEAQYALGKIYLEGDGERQYYDEALEWFQKAANQGNMEAQNCLGAMYASGIGVSKDYTKAFEWFQKAANQGKAEAQYCLGMMYYNGDGVIQNHKKAVEWYQKAANHGYSEALYNLSRMYFYGDGVSQDIGKAFDYVQKAAYKDNINAQYVLGDMYFNGEGVGQDYTKALEWYQKSANQGNADAQNMLGEMYLKGIGVVKNISKGVDWLTKSAGNGDYLAMNTLGWCYLIGEGVDKDLRKAEELFKKAIEKNELYPYPYSNLALLYAQRDKNYGEALSYSDKAIIVSETCSPQEQSIFYGERGQIYVWKGDLENAEKMLTKCLELNPDYLNEDHEFAKMMAPRYNNDVDNNIITNPSNNRNTFAVIIGNEKYKNEVDVPFANNDSRIFYQYVDKTLGVPAEQIRLVENAGYNDIRMAVNWLVKAMQVCRGKGKAIVYYAGHGIPNESDMSSYLLPVDGIGNDPGSAYSLKELYDRLGSVEAQSVTVFLDACFCGSKREEGMLTSARGIALKVKQSSPQGNMIIFSAAQGDETAYPYEEKRHGLFTYYLLKKLQETKGNVTLGSLSDYLTEEVSRQSFVKNNKIQSPTVNVSTPLKNNWRNMRLR